MHFTLHVLRTDEAIYNGEKDVSELGVKAVDDKTLEITLEYSVPYFLSLTDTRAMYPVREDLVEKIRRELWRKCRIYGRMWTIQDDKLET